MIKRNKLFMRRLCVLYSLYGMGLLLFVTGCTTLKYSPLAGLKVSRGRPFVIAQTDKSYGWGNATHPFLSWVSPTRIAVTYWVAGEVAEGDAPVSWPAYSDDFGKTWKYGDPIDWCDMPPDGRTLFIKKGQSFSYDMGLFFNQQKWPNGVRTQHNRLMDLKEPYLELITYDVDQQCWDAPIDCLISVADDIEPRPINLCFENEGVVYNGIGYGVAYGAAEGLGSGLAATYLFATTNQGISYECISCVASQQEAPWGNEGAVEPALAVTDDGELICIMRTGTDWRWGRGRQLPRTSRNLLLARSKDFGKTWTYKELNYSGVMPKLLKMSNGVLVSTSGAPGNALIFSTNNGRTWGGLLPLAPHSNPTSGYCDLLEVEPGRLLCVYDQHHSDLKGIWLWEPKEVNGIMGLFVDVKRLWGGKNELENIGEDI